MVVSLQGQILPKGYTIYAEDPKFIIAIKDGKLYQFTRIERVSEPGVGQIVIDASGKPHVIPPIENIPIPIATSPGGQIMIPPDFPDIPPTKLP